MVQKIPLATPGEILKCDFLDPLGITPYRLAKSTGMQPIAISEIVGGTRGITPETALKFGVFFEMTPEFWLNLQLHFDLEKARNSIGAEVLARITPLRLLSLKPTGDVMATAPGVSASQARRIKLTQPPRLRPSAGAKLAAAMAKAMPTPQTRKTAKKAPSGVKRQTRGSPTGHGR